MFYVDSLHLIQDGNNKLSESIVNVIKLDSKTTEVVSMSSKLFNYAADFNFSDKDFPPLTILFDEVHLFVLVMLVQVDLFVIIMGVHVNLFLRKVFVQVNLFLLVMFVQVTLFILIILAVTLQIVI